MPPTDEAHFIALWQERHPTAEIAKALDIPRGTGAPRRCLSVAVDPGAYDLWG